MITEILFDAWGSTVIYFNNQLVFYHFPLISPPPLTSPSLMVDVCSYQLALLNMKRDNHDNLHDPCD